MSVNVKTEGTVLALLGMKSDVLRDSRPFWRVSRPCRPSRPVVSFTCGQLRRNRLP
jgi:hypothetical protein